MTDVTNAHRTMLVDFKNPLDYDESLLDYFGIERRVLPLILPNLANYGKWTSANGTTIPIVCSIGDQQAAFYGISFIQLIILRWC